MGWNPQESEWQSRVTRKKCNWFPLLVLLFSPHVLCIEYTISICTQCHQELHSQYLFCSFLSPMWGKGAADKSFVFAAENPVKTGTSFLCTLWWNIGNRGHFWPKVPLLSGHLYALIVHMFEAAKYKWVHSPVCRQHSCSLAPAQSCASIASPGYCCWAWANIRTTWSQLSCSIMGCAAVIWQESRLIPQAPDEQSMACCLPVSLNQLQFQTLHFWRARDL